MNRICSPLTHSPFVPGREGDLDRAHVLGTAHPECPVAETRPPPSGLGAQPLAAVLVFFSEELEQPLLIFRSQKALSEMLVLEHARDAG